MRYYAIKFDGAGSAFPVVPGCDVPGAQFSTVAYGQNDPGALRCELYIDQRMGHVPNVGSFVRLWGVSIDMINQTSNLNGKAVEVYGGMYPGLPLASKQSVYRGRLVSGMIQAAFGNWQGPDISLDLILTAGSDPTSSAPSGSGQGSGGASGPSPSPQRLLNRRTQYYSKGRNQPSPASIRPSPVPLDILGDISSAASGSGIGGILGDISNVLSGIAKTFGGGGWNQIPVNLIHNLEASTPLSSGIQQTLSAAFPGYNINVAISDALKLAYPDKGFYQSAQQMFGYWKSLSHSILGTTGYAGVQAWADGKNINVLDHTKEGITKSIDLDYFDLIGQPTWIELTKISIKMVMRSDINPGDTVNLPSDTPVSISVPTNESFLGFNLHSLTLGFTGSFNVDSVTHVGDSRHPDGAQWCTVITAWSSASQTSNEIRALSNAAAHSVYDAPSTTPSTPAAPSRLFRRKLRRYA
jgi:hypothetical protein